MKLKFLNFLKDFTYLFLERKREGEKEKNCVAASCAPSAGNLPETQACDLTGNFIRDPLGHRPALNPLSYTSQGKIFKF